MAYRTPVLFLIASLLISMSWVAHSILPNHNPPANAPSPSNNDPLARVRIAGVLRCRVPPRNPPIIEPLVAGVNVVLSCDGGSTVIADAVTNTDGFFEVLVDSASSILFGGSNTGNCKIKPRLPIAGCAVSVPTGVVNDPLGAVQTIIDKLFGNNVISNANDHVVDTGKSYYDPSTVHDEHVVHNQDHNGKSYYNPSIPNDDHVVNTRQSFYDQSTVHGEPVVYNGNSYYNPSMVNDKNVVYTRQSTLHYEPVIYTEDSSYYNSHSSVQDKIHA